MGILPDRGYDAAVNRTPRGPLGAATLVLIAAILHASCAAEEPPVFEAPDRVAGDRAPRGLGCEDLDDARCLLPWPSNAFTVADPSRETGLRLEVNARALNSRDRGDSLALADGFSPVSPILAVFDRPLDPGTLEAAVHLYVAQPGSDALGREIPLRLETVEGRAGATLLIADPRQVLASATDHVVVIDDALLGADGAPIASPHGADVALDRVAPATQEEADLRAYHAPIRAFLTAQGIALDRVVMAWDFTTRSEASPRRALLHMRARSLAALEAGELGVELDNVVVAPDGRPDIALLVYGRLTGVPTFLDGDAGFVPDADGLPMELGRTDAPFRVLVPAGTEGYRFLMYGHGTGGNQDDDAFDAELASAGLAKVNVRLYGWTDTDVIATFAGLQQTVQGSFAAAAYLVEALAHAATIEAAMTSVLGDTLAAAELDGAPNPAAGRRPDGSIPFWVGGSLGGTTGVVYAASDPRVRYAVVNVPGAAWSQWVWHSGTFDLIHELLGLRYDDDIDLSTGLAIAQTNLDLADGAVWASALEESPTAFLVQESMGDPIMPNQATEMVAAVTGARMVGGVLEPIDGVESAPEVIEGSAITQFRAPEGGDFDVHGFAARDTPAGDAARQQIFDFVTSALAGEARIAPPADCPDGCDYR